MARVSWREFEQTQEAAPVNRRAHLKRVTPAPREWLLRALPQGDATLLLVHGDSAASFQDLRLDDRYVVHLPLTPSLASLFDRASPSRRADALSADRHYRLQTDAATRWLVLHFEDGKLQLRGQSAVSGNSQDLDWRVMQSESAFLRSRIALLSLLFESGGETEDDVRQHAREVAARQLLEAVVRVFHDGGGRMRGRKPMDRKPIIERCLDLIDAQLSRAISIDELCATAGVSDRTLRTMFAEQFGVSPHRYLMNRRMQAIHEALCSAREGTTVTSVCSDYGVWDFGRFARQYRQLYGVLPSQDLRAPRREVELTEVDAATITPCRAQFLRNGSWRH